MFSHRLLMLALLSTIALLIVGAAAPQSKQQAIKRLLSTDAGTRIKAQQELLTARANLISELAKIVDDNENQVHKPDSVRKAMFILGEMRAIEAVGVLVSNIAFPDVLPPGKEPRPGPGWGMGKLHTIASRPLKTWPAVEALTKIGEPCLEATIEKIATTDGVTEQNACIRVLIEVRGRDSASALLKHAINKQKVPQKSQRLQNTLDRLLRIKPKKPRK